MICIVFHINFSDIYIFFNSVRCAKSRQPPLRQDLCNASTSCVTTTWEKISRWLINKRIYAEIKFFHISDGSETPLMSALKLFVDTFVSFMKMDVIIISL